MSIDGTGDEQAAETAARRAALDSALGSLQVDGLQPSPACRALLQDWAAGRGDIDAVVAQLLRPYRQGLIAS